MKIKKTKKIELSLLVLFPILATIISLLGKTNFLVSIVLFFLPLMVYLSFKDKKAIIKSSLFALFLTAPIFIVFDYLAVIGRAWYVPTSVVSWRFLGAAPIEDLLLGFCFVYSVVIFYEYFFDKTGKEKVHKNMKYFAYLFSSLLVLFFVLILFNFDNIRFSYNYLWLGLAIIVAPISIVLYKYPKLIYKFIKTGIYFSFVAIFLELTGLYLDQWTFPGEYIGWIEFFNLRMPFEEWFFWVLLVAVAILSFYEFFDDDRK